VDLVLTGTANAAATGNSAANRLEGNDGRNALAGAAGNDQLLGGGASDALAGGEGRDTLEGGAGADTFLFDTPPSGSGNVDTLADFARGSDLLALDADVFTAFTAGSPVAASQIRAGAGFTTATTAEHRLVYDSTSGALYYDADGAGGAAAVRFATIATVPGTLGSGDFGIVG
jgi:Ca2+-binding RTX toxin-like protein